VSWVSKLKEHYDKQGKPETSLEFAVAQESDGCFVASIFIAELETVVQGLKASSKKQAKQNAAEKAMILLSKRT